MRLGEGKENEWREKTYRDTTPVIAGISGVQRQGCGRHAMKFTSLLNIVRGVWPMEETRSLMNAATHCRGASGKYRQGHKVERLLPDQETNCFYRTQKFMTVLTKAFNIVTCTLWFASEATRGYLETTNGCFLGIHSKEGSSLWESVFSTVRPEVIYLGQCWAAVWVE
jgi:hypothetical protein